MKLSEYIEQHGMTLTAFAGRIGRAVSTVSRIARGKTRPDWDTINAIQAATEGAVTANDFAENREAA